MFENENQFRQYIDNIKLDDTPRPGHRRQLWDRMLKQAGQAKGSNFSIFTNRTLQVAAAAVILIAAGLGLFMLTNPGEPAGSSQIAQQDQSPGTTVSEDDTQQELAAVLDLFKAKDVDGLIAVLQNGTYAARLMAAEALSNLGDARAVAALQLAAKNDYTGTGENPFQKAADAIEKQNSGDEADTPDPSAQAPDNTDPDTQDADAESMTAAVAEPNEPAVPEGPGVKVYVTEQLTGSPLANVNIKKYQDNKRENYTTDKNGYAWVDLGEGKVNYLSLLFTVSAHVPMHQFWRVKDQNHVIPKELHIEMPVGTTISGRVMNRQNEPITDADVEINLSIDDVPGQANIRLRDHVVKTDKDGRWTCDIMPAEISSLNINLSHPAYADFGGWTSEIPPVEKFRDGSAVLYMQTGIDVTGYVYDTDGNPVENAEVLTGADRYSERPKTKTSAEGYYEFKNMPGDFLILTVCADGFAPVLTQFTLTPESSRVDFYLEPPHTISGRVVDPDGNPLKNVHFSPDSWQGARTLNYRGKTDAEGNFTWSGAPADVVLMDFYRQGCMDERNIEMSHDQSPYEVVMYPALEVTGTVTDAQTGEPIDKFAILKGYQWQGQESIYWGDRYDTKQGQSGTYKYTFSQSNCGHVLKIEADGYAPAVSRVFDSYEGKVTYDFALEKGDTGYEGFVYLPDAATPAKDAKVYLSTSANAIQMQNGRVNHRAGSKESITDSKGRFAYTPPLNDYLVVAIHDKGFAYVRSGEFESNPAIVLQPWGKVEGTLYVGSKPGAGERISLSPQIQWDYNNNEPRFHAGYSTLTDEKGQFQISRVIPGPTNVSRVQVIRRGSYGQHKNLLSEKIEVLSGELTEVILGGIGQPIEGRLVPAAGVEILDYNSGQCSIRMTVPESVRAAAVKEMPYPEPANLDTMTYGEVVQWYKDWHESEEGQAYMKEMNEKYQVEARVNKYYNFVVNPDGSFHIDDVEPGTYDLDVRFYSSRADGGWDYSKTIASAKLQFTVPETAGGQTDTVFDLGTITLKAPVANKGFTANVPAPPLTGRMRNGAQFDLANYRGKTVLLYFWNLPMGGDIDAQVQAIKDAQQLGEQSGMTFIGVSPGTMQMEELGKKLLDKFFAENDISGQHVLCDWSQIQAWGSFQVRYFTISPDGIVTAAGKDLEIIREALQ